jgi:hypothetical protein
VMTEKLKKVPVTTTTSFRSAFISGGGYWNVITTTTCGDGCSSNICASGGIHPSISGGGE